MLPKKIYLNYIEEDDEDKTWSEQPVSVADCEMQNREYTDLSQVWHPSSEKPQENKQIVAINLIYTVYGGFYNADRDIFMLQNKCLYMRWEAIQWWAYLNDLLPKGGKP